MNEVSCRASALLIETAERWGFEVARLVGGLPVPESTLRDPRRQIDWDVYVEFLDRLYQQCGGSHEELVRFTESSLQTPTFQPLAALIGVVARPRQLYWLASRWGAPAFFSHVRYHFTDDPACGVRIEAELPPEYRGSSVFFRVGVGVFRALPRVLGYCEAAKVEVTLDSHHATYQIDPPDALPLWSRLRQLRPRYTTHSLLHELVAQQGELQRGYTALAAAHKQLQEQTAQFRLLTENTQDMLAILDGEGRVTYASPSHQRVLGYDADMLIGRHVFDFIHPDDLAVVAQAFAEGMQAGGNAPPHELRFRHGNGSWRILECFGSSVGLDAQPTAIISSRDITERKQAEQRTEMLVEVARSISASLDLQGVLESIQGRIAAVVGCERVATYCFDAERGGFYLAAQHGTPAHLLEEIAEKIFPPGEPFGGHVVQGETIVCNDISAQAWLSPELCQLLGIATYVAAPLRVRSRHFGLVIATNSSPDQPFANDQVQLLEGISRQLGVAIEAAELLRAQQAEADLSAALARVSREMIAASSRPDALTHLCRLTNEVLCCDYSHTWLWDESQQAFAPAAEFGDTPEDWESVRVLRIGPPFAESLLEQLRTHEVLSSGAPGLESLASCQSSSPGRPGGGLIVALRRGDEVFGFHSSGFRDPRRHFTPAQERLARGIGQIAGLAIEHVRVVQALEEANRLKSEFVATMSHELRTPLNVIIGYTDLLRDRVFGELSEEQADALQRVDLRARELFDLITATLDLSRLESGRVGVQVAPLSVGELIAELDAETRDVRNKPGLSFRWEVADSLPALQTDPLKLKVILKNLIGNALKFTENGHVIVAVHPQEGGARFSVQDTGVGIADDVLPVIFEPFRQGHTGLAREYGGVGLGLYIVRRLVDMLNGTVTVDSRVGDGTTFQVWVPNLAGIPSAAAVGSTAPPTATGRSKQMSEGPTAV